MTQPDDRRRVTARDRFRNILSADKEGEGAPEVRKPTVVNLPRLGAAGEESSAEFVASTAPERSNPPATKRFLQSFWTAGGILSILANFILFFMLLSGGGALSPTSSSSGALLGVRQPGTDGPGSHRPRSRCDGGAGRRCRSSHRRLSRWGATLVRRHVQVSTTQFTDARPTSRFRQRLEIALDMDTGTVGPASRWTCQSISP
jgi:hypothetical protein